MKKQITEWQVLTPDGWSDFEGIKQTIAKQIIQLYCEDELGEDELILTCTLNHLLLTADGEWIKAQDIIAGQKLAYEEREFEPGVITVSEILIITEDTPVYDLLNVEKDHAYYTNNLASHNCAFIPHHIAEDLWTSVYPIISSAKNTKCIMVSTPNGTGNLFYTTYTNAQLSKDVDGEKWTPVRIDWWDVPDRDEEWKKKQLVSFNYDMRKWNQEFGNEFLGSTYTLVNIANMSKRKTILFQNPPDHKEMSIKDFKVKIWALPEKHRVYTVGVDVADGTGNDYSVITVYDITTPIKGIPQVASFDNNKISPAKLAFIVAKIGALYNVAPLMVECNAMGETVIDFLHLLYEYPNIASIGHRNFGVRSNKNLKIDACQYFRDIFDGEFLQCIVNEMQLITQLEYFEKHTTGDGSFTYRAQGGNNDDQVLANVWGLYLLKRANLDYFFDVDWTMIGLMEFPAYVQQFDSSWVNDQQEILRTIDRIYEEIHNKEAANLNEAYGYNSSEEDPEYIRSV